MAALALATNTPAKLVEQQIGLYSLPKTEAYLREAGGRLVAAHDEPATGEEARQVGCSACLRKPVPGQLLLAAISKAVILSNHGCK